MKRISILLPLLLTVGILGVVLVVFHSAPVMAQPNAQATSTPAPTAAPSAAASGVLTYATVVSPDADTDLSIELKLYPDNKAEFSMDALGDDAPVTRVGTWAKSGPTVTVTLTGEGGKTYDKPVVITFTEDGETLDATAYDKTEFGDGGLTFFLRDEIDAQMNAMSRAFVTLDIGAGFALDPFIVSVNGGGEVDASALDDKCHGYINGNPTVLVNWTGTADMVRAFTYSDADPVLVVKTPKGEILCGDDESSLALDAQVELAKPEAGMYRIWVGSSQPHQLLPTILVLTTRSDVTLSNFEIGSLVTRPPVPAKGAAMPGDMAATVVTESISRFKSAVAGPLGATPLTKEVTAEGTLAAFDIDFGDTVCNGFIAETPDYVFDVNSALDRFTVYFAGKADSSLLVVGPEGTVQCNDDAVTGTNNNPSVTMEKPVQGRYAVFVGRIDPEAAVTGTLTVTTAANAAPAVLPPAK